MVSNCAFAGADPKGDAAALIPLIKGLAFAGAALKTFPPKGLELGTVPNGLALSGA